MMRLHLYLIAWLTCALLACGSEDLVLPTDGAPLPGGDGGGGTGMVPSTGTSTVSADPASIQVGTGVSTIRVTVRDAAGTPVPGVVVTLSATGSGNTIIQPAGPT